ncbi:TolC family protein [Acidovorax sp. FG27]|uniref:TolC family protein n=1 Tax=Acidovorax sp. FG27 TaxID=3133652 RepID=UPI0030E849F6
MFSTPQPRRGIGGPRLRACAAAALSLAALPALAQPAPAPIAGHPSHGTPHVTAAPVAPTLSTLRESFEAAWARQPEAASAAQYRSAAQARQSVANGWTPEPAALELATKTDRWHRNEGSRELEVGVAVPLWLPGERGHSQALAQAEIEALDARQAAARLRLAGTLREAWWQLHRDRLQVELAQARRDSAARLAADVARRVRAGDLARADQHQADGNVAAAEAELAESRAQLAVHEQALRTLAAQPLGAQSDMPEPLPQGADPSAGPVDEQAVAEHPALREAQGRLRVAERAQALAGAQTRANPELTVATTRERGGQGERYAQTVTVGVRIPFGSSGARETKAAAAAAATLEALAQLELERLRIAGEVASARARLAGASALAQAADRRATLARETQGFVGKAFRAGEIDLPNRLRVELEAADAERQSAIARLNVSQAISALRQALGLLPQ